MNSKEIVRAAVVILVVAAIIYLPFRFAYWVAVSDLPPWFKFWLLHW